MNGRFSVIAGPTSLRPGEDEHLKILHEGEVVVQEFDRRIPLKIEVRDSRHDWFGLHLRVRWCRYEQESVLLDLMEVAIIPDHPEYPIPTNVLSDAQWWKSLIDETTEHLFRVVESFDPGCPDRTALLATGWTSGPAVFPPSAAYLPVPNEWSPAYRRTESSGGVPPDGW